MVMVSACLGIVGVIGNALVIVVLMKVKSSQAATDKLMINQSAIDGAICFLLVCQALIPQKRNNHHGIW